MNSQKKIFSSKGKVRESAKTVIGSDKEVSSNKLDATPFKAPNTVGVTLLRPSSKNGISTIKTPTKGNGIMTKSASSTPITPDKNMHFNIKLKEKSFATPVTHLCSPSLSPKGRKHLMQRPTCSVKRFLSDSSLNDSPLPYSRTGTPIQNNLDEEETSNFVVGVRVRPFNFR